MKVLVVDDSDVLRKITVFNLKNWEWKSKKPWMV